LFGIVFYIKIKINLILQKKQSAIAKPHKEGFQGFLNDQ